MLLPHLLERAARRAPGREAVHIPGTGMLTYAELERRARRVAAWLGQRDVGPGCRVALLGGAGEAGVVGFWGAQCAGAATVDLPERSPPARMAAILEECRPDALIADAARLGTLPDGVLRRGLPVLATGGDAVPEGAEGAPDLRDPAGPPEIPPSHPDDEAVIVYTSGSTGGPKGVRLSHANLLSNLEAGARMLPIAPDDRLQLLPPLHFIHGRAQLLAYARAGATLLLPRDFRLPQMLLEELRSGRATDLSGVPYHFLMLLGRSSLGRTPLPDLRRVLITGGALPEAALEKLAQRLPGVAIHLAYGQTEAAPRITHRERGASPGKGASCGRPLPGLDLRILGDGGEAVPPGRTGEVVVSGPSIMRGYVSGDERESGAVDERGRLHTGDLGELDADGYLYLRGRRSEMIKQAGERIFAGEIAAVLGEHGDVQEVAVVPAMDERFGEIAVGCVRLRAGAAAGPDELLAHCRRRLPYERAPRRIVLLEEIPRGAAGKVDRPALVRRAGLGEGSG